MKLEMRDILNQACELSDPDFYTRNSNRFDSKNDAQVTRPIRRLTKSRLSSSVASCLLALVLSAAAVLCVPRSAVAGEIAIGVSLRVGPPPIPIYTQPICPGAGFMWTPGYWSFDPDEGYYWVPGTWVAVPEPGLYWTPGYWGWGGSLFVWHGGYWGPHVGFYGGINYGFGYTGVGFLGGEWRGRDFYYNRSVSNVTETHITNVYYRNVTNNFASNRVSYSGGEGGLTARPGREEIAAEHERRIGETPVQREHQSAAHQDRSQFAAVNHGTPHVAATQRAGELKGPGVVAPNRAVGSVNPGGTGRPGEPGGAGKLNNDEHKSGYSGFHNPNAVGAPTHQPATNYGHATGSTGETGAAPRGGTYGHDQRSTPPFHNSPEGRPPANYGNSSRPAYTRPSAPTTPNNTITPHAGFDRPTGGVTPHQQNSPKPAPAPPHSAPPSGGEHGGHEPEHHH